MGGGGFELTPCQESHRARDDSDVGVAPHWARKVGTIGHVIDHVTDHVFGHVGARRGCRAILSDDLLDSVSHCGHGLCHGGTTEVRVTVEAVTGSSESDSSHATRGRVD